MSVRRNTPCDLDGICPYEDMHSGYWNSCEYWCGDDEPEDYPDCEEITDAEYEASFEAAAKMDCGPEFWERWRF